MLSTSDLWGSTRRYNPAVVRLNHVFLAPPRLQNASLVSLTAEIP